MRAVLYPVVLSCVTSLSTGCGSGGAEGTTATAGAAGLGTGGGATAGGGVGASSSALGGAGNGGVATAGGGSLATGGTGGSLGSGGGSGGAGAPSEPRPTIAGAVLWLEATESASLTLEQAHVATWQDLTDSHNDAAQSSDGLRPSLVPATGSSPAVLHFEAARHTFLGIPDAESLHFGKGDFTVAVVFAFTNEPFAPGAPGEHLGGWAFTVNKITQPSGPRIGWGIMGNWPTAEDAPVRSAVGCETTEAGGSLLTKQNGYNDGALHLWVMRRVTAQNVVELRENGAVNGTAKGGPFLDGVDTVGTAITIGGARLNPGTQNSARFSLDGDVAAVVAVKGTLADASLETLEQYLMKQYRIAP